MTFTYDPSDLSTDVAKVRLAIRDTEAGKGILPDGKNFQDEELQVFLTMARGIWQAATPIALRTAATAYAAKAHSVSMGDYSESLTTIASELRAQAEVWEKTIPGRRKGSGLGTSVATPDWTQD